jgi:hypothetical protein
MTTLVEQLSSESLEGGRFAIAFAIGAVLGTGIAAILVSLALS